MTTRNPSIHRPDSRQDSIRRAGEFQTDPGHVIRAGCRTMTIDGYRAHVASDYPDTDKARETLGILDFFAARLAHI